MFAWCLAMLGPLFIPVESRADSNVELTAGDPKVLKHPEINKSIGNPVYCLTFVNDGATLATGAASGLLIWNVETGKLQETVEVDERGVDALSLDPCGKLLVAGGATGTIKVFDAQTFKPMRVLGPTPGAVRALAISPDGKLLASASPNGQLGEADEHFGIMLWNLTTGKLLRTIPHPPPSFGTTALAFMPDGKRLVSAQDRTFRVIDVEQGHQTQAVELPDLLRSLGSISLSKDGERLLAGAFEPKLRIWNAANWTQALAWDAHDREPPPQRGVSSVNFSPDGRFVVSGGMDGMVCVWDATSGKRLLELDGRGEESSRWITGVVMSPDGRWLAAAHYGGTATMWRISETK